MSLFEVILVIVILFGDKNTSFIHETIDDVYENKELKYRMEFREENPGLAHRYPIEDDSQGSVGYPNREYEIPYTSILYNVDSCDDLQKLCNQPIWGTITDKKSGKFKEDKFDFSCRCSW